VQRLERLGKEINPESDDVLILISGDTAQKKSGEFTLIAVGNGKLQGHIWKIDFLSCRRGVLDNVRDNGTGQSSFNEQLEPVLVFV